MGECHEATCTRQVDQIFVWWCQFCQYWNNCKYNQVILYVCVWVNLCLKSELQVRFLEWFCCWCFGVCITAGVGREDNHGFLCKKSQFQQEKYGINKDSDTFLHQSVIERWYVVIKWNVLLPFVSNSVCRKLKSTKMEIKHIIKLNLFDSCATPLFKPHFKPRWHPN